ncbi:PDZ domain-containing protein [Modestobacter sp. I12A-02628]|uniref:PDZ domain-containing protein n=1 Tax=Goekera deserti TaxID=2497753 RepID=A0A7K3WKY5_9ACTN|nr:trypsin-like peptidase domain-containing protein [Goekera deserti]MPQ98198.1 PDZ domain-containing protein [Goekera deserti]NDI48848.1 PDZ domain-containing protein [Goekera deserti]NEL56529.1 PDZ domain-containing protein [Goekera deserti]
MTEQNRPADETGENTGAQGGSAPADRAAGAVSGATGGTTFPTAGTPAPGTQTPGTQSYGSQAPGTQAGGWQQPGQAAWGTPPHREQTQQFPSAQHPGQPQPAQYGGQPTYQARPPAGYPQPAWQQAGDHASVGAGHGGHLPPTGGLPPVFQPPAAPQPAKRAGRGRLVVAALLAGALIGGGAGAGVVALDDDGGTATAATASAQSVVIKDAQNATSSTAAAAKAAPSVVTIYVSGAQGSGSGSGIVYSADGYVITNNHVVTLDSSTDDATIQVRTSDGTLYDASVVGTDPTSDLAVVKLADASGLTPATWADSDDVQVGDLAVAIGSPLGLENTVTDGIISATDRAVATGSDADQTVIQALQTDAAINPGNSGGALVDAAGAVIGVNSSIATVSAGSSAPGQPAAQSGNIGVGFAIPGNLVQRIADEIVQTGKAEHALLGVSAATASENGSQVGEGAQVQQVSAGGAAAEAGIQPGDVITSVDGEPVTSSIELTAAVRSAEPGAKVTLTVQRDGNTRQVDVTLGTATS